MATQIHVLSTYTDAFDVHDTWLGNYVTILPYNSIFHMLDYSMAAHHW